MGFADYASGVIRNNRKLQNRLGRSFIKTKETTVSGSHGISSKKLQEIQPLINRANNSRRHKIGKELILYLALFFIAGLILYMLNAYLF